MHHSGFCSWKLCLRASVSLTIIRQPPKGRGDFGQLFQYDAASSLLPKKNKPNWESVLRQIVNCLLLLSVCSVAMAEDWRLVWQDEFDGTSLDVLKWEIEVNAFGGGNHELQIYTDRNENVRVENGHLVLAAHKRKYGIAGTERDFSSGRIRSKRRGDWKYGKMEIRAKLPQGQGIWPAIWMLPTDDTYGVWASSGEIDIMEFKGQEPDTIWGTLHYGQKWPDNMHTGETFKLANGNFSDDFHTYAVEWEEGVIRWYVDGKLWQTQTKWSTPNGEFPAPFDQRFHMVLNVSVGGEFLGNPDDSTVFPAKMLVDYVRVYQR
jgi:beta-glucanase (GH16 family)